VACCRTSVSKAPAILSRSREPPRLQVGESSARKRGLLRLRSLRAPLKNCRARQTLPLPELDSVRTCGRRRVESQGNFDSPAFARPICPPCIRPARSAHSALHRHGPSPRSLPKDGSAYRADRTVRVLAPRNPLPRCSPESRYPCRCGPRAGPDPQGSSAGVRVRPGQVTLGSTGSGLFAHHDL
jgi:hypothetical protein